MALRHADMMKEAYAQSIECEEPCEGRLSRTVLLEGEGETPSLYSTLSPMKYNKENSSPSELISILQSRGLDCSDIDNAIDILSSIGYYRLSGYFYPFLLTPKSEHIFLFQKIM